LGENGGLMKLRDLLSQEGVEFREAGQDHHARSGWLQLRCPWCQSRSFHLGFNEAHGHCSCWKCGAHRGDETLARILRISTGQAYQLLRGVDLIRAADRPPRPIGTLQLPPGAGPLLKQHKQYLQERGFDPEQIVKLWHIQGIGLAVDLAWRLLIPWEYQGRVVSWTTRAISDQPAMRYISASALSESLNHKELLYGEDLVHGLSIGVVEGQLDVWAGGPGWVATGGTAYTRAQVLRLSRYLKRVVCFDNEPAAQRRALELCNSLSAFEGETIRVCPDGKDLAATSEADRRQIGQLIHP